MQCLRCEHIFAEGQFTNEALAILFETMNPGQMPGQGSETTRAIWAPTVKEVAGFRYPGRWLDVGFGNGGLLELAAEWGYEVLGIDTREQAVAAMQSRGFNATTINFHSVLDEEFFDVISFFDVIEHLPFPKETLRHAKKMLKPEGVLVVSMPNMDSAAWRDLDAREMNPYWSEIEHLHNFSRKRLVLLLEECGFDFLSFEVPTGRWRLGMQICARNRS
jgi:2-polyprenyl-3-methyl-5-hydroxy-6-metoxy-1,4-benzoquinol methylase